MGGRIKTNEKSNRLPFPTIGRIACGMKSEKGFPQSLDFWVASGKYANLFKEAYGEKPTTIQVVFPSDDASLVCREEYTFRDNAGKLVANESRENLEMVNECKKPIMIEG